MSGNQGRLAISYYDNNFNTHHRHKTQTQRMKYKMCCQTCQTDVGVLSTVIMTTKLHLCSKDTDKHVI